MPVRLLAHGGTTFAERARIGRWPTIHVDVLQDNYGVGPGILAYGLGLLGGEPFLILRERQKSGERYYPYTLLLDPGTGVWKSFGWNAAALASSILRADRSPDTVAGKIWADPARIREEDLTKWLDGLFPEYGFHSNGEALRASPETAASVPQIWFASFFGAKPLMVIPAQIGLTSRPEPALLAAVLDSLPEPFRAARGWLIGGAMPHASAYGSQIVLDDVRTDALGDSSDRIAQGVIVGNAWTQVKASSLAHYLEALETEPAPGVLAARLDAEAPSLVLVAQSLEGKVSGGRLIEQLQDKNVVTGLFSDLIWGAAADLCVNGQSELTDSQTSTAVRYACQKKIELPTAIQKLAAPNALNRTLREFGYPEKKLSFLRLSSRAGLEHWLTRIFETDAEVSGTLAAALDAERWSAEQKSKLIDAALKRAKGSPKPLNEWSVLRTEPEISKWLTQQANKRLDEQSPVSWAEDFLRFGDTNQIAERLPKDPQALLQLANASQNEIQRDVNALRVLEALAGCNTRDKLPLRTKRAIATAMAERFPESPWSAFHAMDELFHGGGNDPIVSTDDTISWLQKELKSLVEEQRSRPNYPAPNLISLALWNKLLDEPLIDMLVTLTPDLSDADSTRRWLDGIGKLGRKDILHREMLREVGQGGEIDIGEAGGQIPKEVVRKWLGIKLFHDTPDDPRVLPDLMRQAGSNAALRNELIHAVQSGLSGSPDLTGFISLNNDHGLRTQLFALLREDEVTSRRAAGAILRGNVNHVNRIAKGVLDGTLTYFHYYQIAALRFVKDERGASELRIKYNTMYCTNETSIRGDKLPGDRVPADVDRALEMIKLRDISNASAGKKER